MNIGSDELASAYPPGYFDPSRLMGIFGLRQGIVPPQFKAVPQAVRNQQQAGMPPAFPPLPSYGPPQLQLPPGLFGQMKNFQMPPQLPLGGYQQPGQMDMLSLLRSMGPRLGGPRGRLM